MSCLIISPEISARFLEYLGYSSCLTGGNEANPENASPVFFIHVSDVFRCATVCKRWSQSIATDVKALVVTPISFASLAKRECMIKNVRERAYQLRAIHMKETVRSLALILGYFPALQSLAVVGGTGLAIEHQLSMNYDSGFAMLERLLLRDSWPQLDDFVCTRLGTCCPELRSIRSCQISKQLSSQALSCLFRGCPKLEEINLQHLGAPRKLTRLSASWIWCHVPALRTLDVSYLQHFNDECLSIVLNRCRNLEELVLDSTRVSGAGLVQLTQKALPHLRSLGVDDLHVSKQDLHMFLMSSTCSKLARLSLANQKMDEIALQLLAKHAKCLEWISLQHDGDLLQDDNPGYSGSSLLAYLQAKSGKLRALHIASGVFHAGIPKLLVQKFPELLQIDLGELDIALFKDVDLLEILEGCVYLRYLGIDYCEGLSLFGRQLARGPVQFANLLAKGEALRWVSVMGCSRRALKLLRDRFQHILFSHEGGLVDFDGGKEDGLDEYRKAASQIFSDSDSLCSMLTNDIDEHSDEYTESEVSEANNACRSKKAPKAKTKAKPKPKPKARPKSMGARSKANIRVRH